MGCVDYESKVRSDDDEYESYEDISSDNKNNNNFSQYLTAFGEVYGFHTAT